MLSNLFEKCPRCHLTQFLCYSANAGNCTLSLQQPLEEASSHSNHDSLQVIWKIEYQAIKGKYVMENTAYMSKRII